MKIIKKMSKKAVPRTIMVCAAVLMMVINVLALNFTSVSLMLIAGIVSLCIFVVKDGKEGTAILWNLFLGFLKVGCFSFGDAYAAIPLIRDIVLSYGWLDEEMLTYMIAVSGSTTGPIMVNLATYVGTSQAGFIGAMIATFAVVLPSFLIMLAVTAVLPKVIKNKYVQVALRGIKPSMIGIILATGCWMIFKNLFDSSFEKISIRAVIITAILCEVYFGHKKILKKSVSPIMLIVISALLGIVGYAL